jgi:uridine kinase
MSDTRLRDFIPPGGKLYVIAIAGRSGAGKSELAGHLAQQLAGWAPVLVPLDAYYRDLAHLDPVERGARNFDHPDALDRELLIEQLTGLTGGLPVDMPVYDFATHARSSSRIRLKPGWVVIIEGLYALYWEEVRELTDMALFVDTADETCLQRRLTRDTNLRGRTEDFVREQYDRTVRPMYEKYVRPTRRFADLIIGGEDPIDVSAAAIVDRIEGAGRLRERSGDDRSGDEMSDEEKPLEKKLPSYVIEGARSSRSRCRTCRRRINKGALRLGILIEGPYGTGYLWHHLKCAARSQFSRLEEAYGLEAWKEAKTPPSNMPALEKLRSYSEEAEERKKKRKQIPYAEVDPSGRAKCKQCGELLEKGSVRVVIGRLVEFGSQVRTAPIHVHPGCVIAGMMADDSGTTAEGFEEALRRNSGDLPQERLDAVLKKIGDLTSIGRRSPS